MNIEPVGERRLRRTGIRRHSAAAVQLIFAFGLLFMGAGRTLAADAPKPLDAPVKLVVGAVNSANWAPIAVMADRLKKLNVQMEVVKFVRYADARTALASGSLDLATLGPADLPIAVSQGIKGVIALMGNATSAKYVVTAKNAKFEKWNDLCGKKIGVAPGSAVWFQFVATLKEQGVAYNCMTPIQIQGGGNNMDIALKRGDIDALVSWEPFESTPVVEGYGSWAMALDYSLSKAVGSELGMLGGAATALKDPAKKAAIDRFIWVLLDVDAELEKSPETKLEAVRQYTGLEGEVVKRIAKNITFKPVMTLEQMQRQAKLFHELGTIQKDVSGELAAYYQDEIYRKYAK